MSITRQALPFTEFTVTIKDPRQRGNTPLISILENGKFNMNSKLSKILGGQKVSVSFTKDYQHLLLSPGEGVFFPKSGSRDLPECRDALRARGVTFPVRYDVWQIAESDCWQGDMLNPMKMPSGGRRGSKKN